LLLALMAEGRAAVRAHVQMAVEHRGPGADFMKQFRPKFTDKSSNVFFYVERFSILRVILAQM
jgi:hypothetical protein